MQVNGTDVWWLKFDFFCGSGSRAGVLLDAENGMENFSFAYPGALVRGEGATTYA